jgi:hypothetical protein
MGRRRRRLAGCRHRSPGAGHQIVRARPGRLPGHLLRGHRWPGRRRCRNWRRCRNRHRSRSWHRSRNRHRSLRGYRRHRGRRRRHGRGRCSSVLARRDCAPVDGSDRDGRRVRAGGSWPCLTCGDRSGRTAVRQQGLRVDVSLVVVGMPDAELHVGAGRLGVAAGTDRPDAVALGNRRALGHRDRPQLRERHRPAVRGQDRHRLAAAGNGPRECHDPRRGSEHLLARLTTDIDAAVLSRRVRMGRIEGERNEDRPVGRPRPRPGRHGCDQRSDRD